MTVHAYGGFDEVARAYEEQVGTGEQDLEEMEGFGDFAAWVGDERWGTLQVYTGDRMLQVTTDPASGRSRKEAARELATEALARLE